MKKYLIYLKYIILISCLMFIATGCSTKSRKPAEMNHAELLKRGLRQLDKGYLASALKTLQTVKDRYPYTESAVVASLKLADTYFDMDEFSAAYDLYSEFDRLHPKDVHIPYVKYQKGMCNFKLIKGFDRDQIPVQRARFDFLILIKQYPEDEYTVKARRKLRQCLLYITKFEIYTGNFYFKQKKYRSALQRFNYVINNFPDLGQYHEALEKISICNLKLAELNKKALGE